mgnify:CR=1 FL=1
MILVDADACPVIRLIEQIAEKYSVPCILFCDTNHVLSSDYSEVKVIGAGMDAVDFALVGACSRGRMPPPYKIFPGHLQISPHGASVHSQVLPDLCLV